MEKTARTAEDLMTASVLVAPPQERVADVLDRLRAERPASAAHVFLVDDDGMLIGQTPIESVVTSDLDERVGRLRGDQPIAVAPGDTGESVALAALTRHDADVAVVSEDGKLMGAIAIGRLLALLHDEHVDDMLRMAGVARGHPLLHDTRSIIKSFEARLPWLMIGLTGGLLAGAVVRGFERALEAEIMLAFFIPLVVYMADAVGTQTETVLVRSLAHGEVRVRDQLAVEIQLGLLLGSLLGTLASLGLYIFDVPMSVATVVGLSLGLTVLIATIVASILPLALTRLGADPALASGPIATVVQDILSVAVYLGVATLLL